MNNRRTMLSLDKLVYNYITGEESKSNLEISDLFDNYEDIEIAMQIWEEVDCEDYNIVDIEEEVAYLRKNRDYTIVE
jgi:hypothetical protein